VQVSPNSAAGPWGTERLAPVLAAYEVPGEDAAPDLCARLLERGGAGHTAAVHTRSRARAVRFAEAVPVSRVILNGPASQGCIGLGKGLTPSLALGCGVAGGAVTTDNLPYRHLLHVSRIATPVSSWAPRSHDSVDLRRGAVADGYPSPWSGGRNGVRAPAMAGEPAV
jgi:hypothetical protein